jgi:hypothetical protein
MSLPKCVICAWTDTTTTPGWRYDSSDIQPALVITMGFIIGEDERYLKLSPTVTASSFADATVILKTSIVFRKAFKVEAVEKWLERN